MQEVQDLGPHNRGKGGEEKNKNAGKTYFTQSRQRAKCCKFFMHNELFSFREQSVEKPFHIVARFIPFHPIARVPCGPDCRLLRMNNALLICPFLFFVLSPTFLACFFPYPHLFPFADPNLFSFQNR